MDQKQACKNITPSPTGCLPVPCQLPLIAQHLIRHKVSQSGSTDADALGVKGQSSVSDECVWLVGKIHSSFLMTVSPDWVNKTEDKQHSYRPKKLCNTWRNRFAIVQHECKSLPTVITSHCNEKEFIAARKWLFPIIWWEVGLHTRKPQRLQLELLKCHIFLVHHANCNITHSAARGWKVRALTSLTERKDRKHSLRFRLNPQSTQKREKVQGKGL